jgi:hypothetical protein
MLTGGKEVIRQFDVTQLHEVWEKVHLNIRLMTELSSTKLTLKFA